MGAPRPTPRLTCTPRHGLLVPMTLARTIFGFAAVYGICVLLPGLFIETGPGGAFGPGIALPEFYYGFYGSALVWQLGFLVIAHDPVRYRPLMLVAILEKAAFFIACLALWAAGRIAIGGPFIGAMIDGAWMLAFLVAWARTAKAPPPPAI